MRNAMKRMIADGNLVSIRCHSDQIGHGRNGPCEKPPDAGQLKPDMY